MSEEKLNVRVFKDKASKEWVKEDEITKERLALTEEDKVIVGMLDDLEQLPYLFEIPDLAVILCRKGYRKQSEGEWVDQYQGKYVNQLYKCSVCGDTAFHDDKRWFLTHYCPNCGAKMKGGAE